MEYQILVGEGFDRLERAVQDAIDKGWEPVGGVSSPAKTRNTTRKRRVAQAMVRQPENQPEEEPTFGNSDNVSEDSDAVSEQESDDSEPADSGEEDGDYVEASEPKE